MNAVIRDLPVDVLSLDIVRRPPDPVSLHCSSTSVLFQDVMEPDARTPQHTRHRLSSHGFTDS